MENKNLREKMPEILSALTDEQKEKAKSCKTVEELLAMLNEAGVPLQDEVLDNVVGGGSLEDLDLIEKLTLWDELCKQRGISVYDSYSRNLVWEEINK